MLQISKKNIPVTINFQEYTSFKKFQKKDPYKKFNRILLLFLCIIIAIFFLPWTQNIQGKGYITTLRPEQRPQKVQSEISGRVEKWFVKEGDFVKKGDTIMKISEIKSEYFDTKLAERTLEQLNLKRNTIPMYAEKIKALERQIAALLTEQKLKIRQATNKLMQTKIKVQSDSIAFETAKVNKKIAKRQYDRVQGLYKEDLKSLKEVEEKNVKFQSTLVKLMATQNKWIESKNKVLNAQIEIGRVRVTYQEKISKAQSTLFSTNTAKLEAQSQVSKMQTTYANYSKRRDLHFVLAPQSGYINKTYQAGIGTTFKAGYPLLSIMPDTYEMAVEVYIKPIDMPLITPGVKVRLQFDGWPAIVFSGWDVISYGTYGGEITAIERFISKNGMYRVLIKPDQKDHAWPKGIRIGSGVRTIALLNDVPIWYELWRKINGFPRDFYRVESKEK